MKLISRFIVWYLKRHYDVLDCKNYVVRMYTKELRRNVKEGYEIAETM